MSETAEQTGTVLIVDDQASIRKIVKVNARMKCSRLTALRQRWCN